MFENNYNKLLQHDILTKTETTDLIRQYQQSDDPLTKSRIADKIIRHNFKFIFLKTKRFHRSYSLCSQNSYQNVLFEDLIQEACRAMVKTLDKFEINKGFSLLTYYGTWHFSFCQRYYINNSRVIRIPCHTYDKYRTIQTYIKNYVKENSRKPTTLEIAEGLSLSPESIQNTLKYFTKILSTDILVGEAKDTCLIDILPTTDNLPEDYLENISISESINSLLNELSPTDRLIVELKYGLNGEAPLSLQKVGDRLNPPITREAVRLRLRKSLAQIRGDARAKELLELYAA